MSTTTAAFYVTGGTLRQDAPSYVGRQADKDLYDGLSRGEFCYVLTSRQMGKSSLMVHTAARLRREGAAVVVLDLTALGINLSPEQWYHGLLGHLGRQLDLEDEVDDFWHEHPDLGPLQRFMRALREVALPQSGVQVFGCSGVRERAPSDPEHLNTRTPEHPSLVIFIDEIDIVRGLPFSTDEFFAGIRECYNRRSQDPEFERLTFCLLGVASPSDLIRDTRMTPFNIGRRIELTDFTESEAAPLAAGLGVQVFGCSGVQDGQVKGESAPLAPEHPNTRTPEHLLRRILHWTGGHPYLTQRLCQAIAQANASPNPKSNIQHPKSVDQLCADRFLSPSARETDDNLLFVRDRLLRGEADPAALLDLYQTVRAGKHVGLDDTNPLIDLLRLSGVAQVRGGRLRVRNRIYERVFDREWVTQHMPDAELRRQRAAYRRGLEGAAAVATVIVTVVASLALVAVDQARLARRATAREAWQRRLAERRLYVADISAVQRAWDDGNIQRAQELLDAQRPRPGHEDLRGFEWRYLQHLCRDQSRGTLRGHTDDVQSVAVSPNGKMLATGGEDRTVKLWNMASRRMVASFPARQGEVRSVAFSPDGKILASCGGDGSVRLWDIAAWRRAGAPKAWPWSPSTLHAHRGLIERIAFSPDGKYLASGGREDGLVKLWNLATKQGIVCFSGPINDRPSVAFSPDGRTLAASSGDHTIKLWDLASRRVVASLAGHTSVIPGVAFSPDGKTLASAAADSTVKLWDVASRREIVTLRGHRAFVAYVVFSPDGRTLATACMDGTIKLWDVATKQERTTLKGHTAWVNNVVFFPDGRSLASASDDGTVKLWDVVARPGMEILEGGNPLLSPDGRTLATWSGDNTLHLWDTASGRNVATHRGGKGGGHVGMFSPDSQILATWSGDNTVKLWAVGRRLSAVGDVKAKPVLAGPMADSRQPTAWNEIGDLRGHTAPILPMAFSPDSQILATGSRDHTVKLWAVGHRLSGIGRTRMGPPSPTADSRQPIACRAIATLRGHTKPVGSVAFSPDGKLLATGSGDNTVKLWALSDQPSALRAGLKSPTRHRASAVGRTRAGGFRRYRPGFQPRGTWKEIATFAGTHGPVQFFPDGKKLMTFTGRGRWRLWDLATKQEIRLPEEVVSDDWWGISPDGRTLVSLTSEYPRSDGGIRFWDISARSAVISLKGHTQQIDCAAFSPDGRLLATGGYDKAIILWDVPKKRVVTTLRGHAGWVTGVAFSPDGRTLATGATDGAVKLWSLAIGQEVATLPERTPPFSTVTFSPDGNLLISHSAPSAPSTQTNDSVQLWRAASFAETDGPTRAAPRQPSR